MVRRASRGDLRPEKFANDQPDWYDWGYPVVLDRQNKNGGWSDRHGPMIDTCFALLFLKRANIAKSLTDKLKLLSMHRPLGQPAFDSRKMPRTA